MKMLTSHLDNDGNIVERARNCDFLSSSNPKEVADFFKKNCTTGGFTVQYARNPQTNEIMEIFKKGRLIQRDIKPVLAAGFTEFAFSWAWAPKFFEVDGQKVQVTKKLDLVSFSDILPYKALFGY